MLLAIHDIQADFIIDTGVCYRLIRSLLLFFVPMSSVCHLIKIILYLKNGCIQFIDTIEGGLFKVPKRILEHHNNNSLLENIMTCIDVEILPKKQYGLNIVNSNHRRTTCFKSTSFEKIKQTCSTDAPKWYRNLLAHTIQTKTHETISYRNLNFYKKVLAQTNKEQDKHRK